MATQEQIDKARAAGYSDEQINAYLGQRANSQPVNTQALAIDTQSPPVDAQAPAIDVQSDPVAKARAAGYSEEQIQQYLKEHKAKTFAKPDREFVSKSDIPAMVNGKIEQEPDLEIEPEKVIKYAQELDVDPSTKEGMNAIAKRDMQIRGVKWTAKSAKDFFANAEEVYDVSRPYAWFKAKFGGRAEAEYEDFKQQNISSIIDEAAQRGLYLEYDGSRFYARTPDGKAVAVEPGILHSLGKSKYEITGGIAGGIAGGAIASRVVGPLANAGPLGKLAAGAIVGTSAIVGSIAGEQVDYLEARMNIQEEFDAKLAAEKAMGSAQFGVIGELVGAGVIKAGAKTYRATKDAFEALTQGSTKRAYEILKQSLGGVSDDEVNQIVKSWETLNKQVAPGKTAQEKAMAILPTTQAGGDTIVAKAASKDLSVATSVSNEVANRAKTLLDETAKLADNEAGERILSSLSDYTDQVKTGYNIVKEIGIDAAPKDFKFNLEQLAIKPILENKVATVSDQATRDRFIRTLDSIDNATKSRDFGDLLDLRKTINKLKYKSNLSSDDMAAVNSSLSEIDDTIDKAMKSVGQDAWLEDWKQVNAAYSEYFKVQNNVLFKAVTKKGTSHESIANAFVKFGTSIDDNFYTGVNTYKQVLNKLDAKARADVEGLIVQKLVDKSTIGTKGFNAIDFPKLADSLQQFGFTTPDADRLKQAANALAEVYKNDPKLISLARLGQADFEQGIATSITGKLKMSLVNRTWERLLTNMPTKRGGELTLISKVSKLLDDPLNAQTTKQVLAEIKDDQSGLAKAITELQQQIAKQTAEGTEYSSGKVRIFEDRARNRYTKPTSGAQATSETIALNRIVSQADAVAKSGKDIKRLSAADKLRLVKEGYKAILLDNGKLINLN